MTAASPQPGPRLLSRLELADVAIPRLELLVRYRGRIGREVVARRRSAHPVAALQQVPPHVERETGENRPFEDVEPTKGVAAERPPQLDREGRRAQGET